MRYDGGDCLHHLDAQARLQIQTWQKQGFLLPFCPEVAGGLPVPRAAAEIQGELVRTEEGEDVTAAFLAGAKRALQLCQKYHIRLAILKQGSPSCGNSLINDGSFQRRKVAGEGITARLLRQHEILVLNELQLYAVPHDFNRTSFMDRA